MSADYEGKDPLELAKQAERDMNSYEAKTGNARAGASDSSKSFRHSTGLSMQSTPSTLYEILY
jgi:hypothetical protein